MTRKKKQLSLGLLHPVIKPRLKVRSPSGESILIAVPTFLSPSPSRCIEMCLYFAAPDGSPTCGACLHPRRRHRRYAEFRRVVSAIPFWRRKKRIKFCKGKTQPNGRLRRPTHTASARCSPSPHFFPSSFHRSLSSSVCPSVCPSTRPAGSWSWRAGLAGAPAWPACLLWSYESCHAVRTGY